MDKSALWLFAAECEGGGISAWKTEDGRWANAYPEVTGYLLPTMVKWGAGDLALRSASWLLSLQNGDGSFNGIDGKPRPFDTAAIIEGLVYVHEWSGMFQFINAAERAMQWTRQQIHPYGYLTNASDNDIPEVYNLRASAIIGNNSELSYWKEHGLNRGEQRTHYLAYALEGALNINEDDTWARQQIIMAYNMQSGLMPFYVRHDWSSNHPSFDYCASAQMGILYQRIGLDAGRVYRLLTGALEPNGGLCQSNDDKRQIAWAVKFYLDLKKVMQ